MACCGLCIDDDKNDEVKHARKSISEEGFHGPIHDRRPRDIIMLLVFIAFLCGMGYIAVESLNKGEPFRLVYGVDSYGNICGENNAKVLANNSNSGLDLRNYGFLYYTNPLSASAMKICVAACPDTTNGTAQSLDCGSDNSTCGPYGVCLSSNNPYTIAADTSAEDMGDNDDGCPDYVYDTSSISVLRRCIPLTTQYVDIPELAESFYNQLSAIPLLEDILSDFVTSYDVIGYCTLAAFGVALVVIILMRWMAAPIVYGLVILGLAASSYFSYVVYAEWDDTKTRVVAAGDLAVSSDVRNEKFLYGFMIFCFCFTAIMWLLVIALRNRIRLVVTLFEEASKAMGSMPQLYLSPFWTGFVMVLFLAYWLGVYAYLITSGEPRANILNHVEYETDATYQQMWWYHLFGLFWISQFILACDDIALAGAIAAWYFSKGKEGGLLGYPYSKSICRLIKYHLGSAAFGALIIAIVKMMRYLLEYIREKLDDNAGPIVDFVMKCMACCLWCFEKILKFINKNAYIEIAIYGYSFCTAARQAFSLLAENIIRVAVINTVGDFVLFLLKLIVMGATGTIAYYWIKDDEELHYYGVIIFVICVFAYIIADVFIDVYEMAVDTIFLCFAEDCKRNNGKDKPYFMSDNLLKFMKSGASNETLRRRRKDKVEEIDDDLDDNAVDAENK